MNGCDCGRYVNGRRVTCMRHYVRPTGYVGDGALHVCPVCYRPSAYVSARALADHIAACHSVTVR